MTDKPGAGKSGYDKYVNYKTFSIAVAAFLVLMLLSWLYWPLIGYPGLNPM
jgi:hypothetical protein